MEPCQAAWNQDREKGGPREAVHDAGATPGFAGSPSRPRQAAELEKVGLDVVWVAEAYSFDAPSYMGYLAAKTERVEIRPWPSCPSSGRTPMLIAMTAAGYRRRSSWWALHLSLGACGLQGDRGLPRRALRPTARPLHARSSRSAATCGAREAPLTQRRARRTTSPPGRRGDGTWQAPQADQPPCALPYPDLGGCTGREERGHDGRSGRWLAADLLRAREGQGGLRGPSLDAGGQAADPSLDTLQDRGRRHLRHRRARRRSRSIR